MDGESLLSTWSLGYRYAGARQATLFPELRIDAGDALLVAGPSGCGKSTLARCLSGLIPHLYRGQMDGQVRLLGRDTAQTPLWGLSEDVGLVFQNPAAQMLASSVEEEILFGLENLGLPQGEIGLRLEEALARFGLADLRQRTPQTLSGGEQQKLALAAVLAREPRLLVLDEPLSMLDSTASAELVTHLGELSHSGRALVICEHRQEQIEQLPALRVVRLDGRMTQNLHDPDPPPFPIAACAPFQLDVRDLSVTLGRRQVLQSLTLSMNAGEVVAVVGRNGVGKTTLLRAMAGLQAYGGSVSAGGVTPELALVFQNPDLQFFNATVREEILYGVAGPNESRYTWLLHELGLVDHEHTPPLLLSEGEKKRLALAIALMRAPRHGVLLDEPSLGQDTAHRRRLIRVCRALATAGRLVVMTTHDLALAARADRLVLLGRDGVIADDSPERVLADSQAWEAAGLLLPTWLTAQDSVEVAAHV